MRFTPLEKPSIAKAALAAPPVTPLAAFLLTASVPGVPEVDPLDLVVFFPILCVVSLICGYLGMLLICLPALALLRHFGRLNALSLCLTTTVVGGCLWALQAAVDADAESSRILGSFVIGSGCSLAVVLLFCIMAEIRFRPSRQT